MSNRIKRKKSESYLPVIDENLEAALLDYEDKAELTTAGKYRCRDCGMLFETLEEHDVHHREIHGSIETCLNTGMTM